MPPSPSSTSLTIDMKVSAFRALCHHLYVRPLNQIRSIIRLTMCANHRNDGAPMERSRPVLGAKPNLATHTLAVLVSSLVAIGHRELILVAQFRTRNGRKSDSVGN